MKCTIREINKLVEQIRAGQPPELPEGTREAHYSDPALPGFYIRLLNTGVASWTVQWKSFGRQKKIALGNVHVLDRPDAVRAGRELLAKVTLDRLDPHAARRERMRAAKVTFKTVAPLFIADRKHNLRPRVAASWTAYLTKYYFKPLHNLPIDEITKDQIQTRLADIAVRSGNRTAWMCHAVLRVFFKWALETGKLPEGHHIPMANTPPAHNGPRERVLTDDEIRLIWKTCESWEAEAIHEQQLLARTGKGAHSGSPTTPDQSRVIKLLFLTGCRAQEIGDLRWSEVDLDNGELRIPGERIKNAEELCNPLTDWAVQILRTIEQRPDRVHMFGRSKRPDNRGQSAHNIHGRIDKRITKAGGTPPKDWRVHDIRRTFRTRLAELGVSMDVAEALLGHVGHRKQIERTYNRHDYWAEKKRALAMWEANLRAIIDGTAEKITRPRFGERKKGDTA
jgi:integrase